MGKRLEIELYQYENMLFGKVLHLDESLRGKGLILEMNGYIISSKTSPEMNSYELFLRGENRSADDKMFRYLFDDKDKALRVAKKIKEMVDIINSETIEKPVDVKVIKII